MDDFGFLTNHARVLLSLSRSSSITMRDVAGSLGITERAVQRIVADLEVAGYLRVARQGRRNVYAVEEHLPLRHPSEGMRSVGALLRLADGASLPPPAQAANDGPLDHAPLEDAPADDRRPLESFID